MHALTSFPVGAMSSAVEYRKGFLVTEMVWCFIRAKK